MISGDQKYRAGKCFNELERCRKFLRLCPLSKIPGQDDQVDFLARDKIDHIVICPSKMDVGKMQNPVRFRIHMKKVLLLINPHSRSGQAAEKELVQALADAQHTILNSLPLAENADFNALILQYQKEVDVVIIAGGDGSMNAALPALVDTKLPLLVFPQGTANNLARSYDMPTEPAEAIALIDTGVHTKIDLGSVNNIYFINVAGIGLSAKINRNVSSKAKHFLGVFAFIATAILTFFKMRTFKAKIVSTHEGEEKEVEVHSWQISVCNGKYYGSGLVIEENANLKDETLRLLSTEVKTGWSGLALIPSLLTGRYRAGQEITLLSAKEIKISTKKPMKIDVDGDIKTETPADFKVHPKLLTLLVKA